MIVDQQGKAEYLVGCLNETGNRRRADNVTGLLGGPEFLAYLRAQKEPISKGFFMHIGIDDFGAINSSRGADYGNYILKSVADCMESCLSDNQRLYHLVADQYVIVDLEASSSEDAVVLKEKITDKLYNFIVAENYEAIFSISIGVIDAASGLALRDVIAFVIFAVASITDFFDGMLARKNNWITSFGKFADPIADKMLVNTVLILMVYFHQANVIAVLLMIARDLIVDGLRMSAANSGEVVSAGIFGKLKTVLQMFALVFLLLKDWPFVYMGICMDQILLWAATVASLYSGWIYFNQLKKYVLETM